MPLLDEYHFSDSQPTGWTLDMRGPLGALAQLACGKAWQRRSESTDATTRMLVQWYEWVYGPIRRKNRDIYRGTGIHYTAVRTRLKEWLVEKRQCLEIALHEGRIPRVDLLQQVVSSE